jgi:predicted nucleotidyltransferase component of viral defense system
MSAKIIQERLDGYNAQSIQEEEMALREITQEVALLTLYNLDFYKLAAFHGGTCLRVFYSLNRFSEDLDFALIQPDPDFSFKLYQEHLKREFEAFGYETRIIERKDLNHSVKSIFLKEDSIGKFLNLQFQKTDGRSKSIKIKLEIDTNPPSGAEFENKYCDFPLNFAVTAHRISSLFAGKIQALLSRTYTKGRDWYDFLWYAGRKTAINYDFVKNGLCQSGPWSCQKIQIDRAWILSQLERKIVETDWEEARTDVRRFLKSYELKSLELWTKDFFLLKLKNLKE